MWIGSTIAKKVNDMSIELQKKKLLILGGNALSCDIVNAARSMGVYTIVTDWNEPSKSPAKLVADEYWNISLMDYDTLTANIKQENVHGIITGFTDSYLLPYQHLCEMNGFPCYGTKEQFEKTLDKATFKALCRDNDVDVVPQYDVMNFDKQIISDSNKIIIKPVDNSGSRGICLCERAEDFDSMLQYALSFSQKNEVVLEKYMDCDDVSFEYKIQDGEVILSSICDRYIYKTPSGGSVTSKLIYPSKYISDYMKNEDKKVRRMFQKLGFRNGVLFMQAFTENGNFYFYEMGYRLSGGRHYLFTENQNGTSAVKELVCFALLGRMAGYRLSEQVNPKFQDSCCQLSILCKNEKIGRIDGKETLKEIPEVIDATYYYNEGDTVGKEGTTAQILARFHIVAHDDVCLNDVLLKIEKSFSVLNEKGENIIIKIS